MTTGVGVIVIADDFESRADLVAVIFLTPTTHGPAAAAPVRSPGVDSVTVSCLRNAISLFANWRISLTKPVTVAVGDIHGCFDALTALLDACETITAGSVARFVFVGDYVDRGPDSRKIVDLLSQKQRAEPDRFICLLGNHEEMLVRAAAADRSDRDLMSWWGNGGESTLDSYGVNDPGDLPLDHLDWIRSRPISFSEQHRFYVHAGIRPAIPIASQGREDMLWIREPFLSSEEDHGIFIVHGHTPTKSRIPDLRSNRLNLDTGACFGGRLTAAIFTSDQVFPHFFIDNSGAARRAT